MYNSGDFQMYNIFFKLLKKDFIKQFYYTKEHIGSQFQSTGLFSITDNNKQKSKQTMKQKSVSKKYFYLI